MTIPESETTVGGPSHWEVVLRAWEVLDLPDGWRAEIIEGAISIMTPPKDEHAHIVALLNRWIVRATLMEGALAEVTVHQNIDLRVPLRSGLYIPDLVALPGSIMLRGPEHGAEDALLVVEVTSRSTAKKDRGSKLWGYAQAGIPFYLLVDRWDPESGRGEVTLFGDPEKGRYTSVTKVPFGKEIHLPEPFDLTLDTGAFPS
ncbi:Uma2 family endonuclease [Nocardiopsis sp. B62]|uniref:Uma2 family endonuclease n=1 Tax=Nocardiopsis sp. B62 TaxID=2824874 RepID=UPI001B384310|nr:Uma2 family endonuclease [Nocardiopsis sp. B62]MBQ1084494.1 Uma2 family endonuclease [Nocardiopsis sp. B62]